jgi:hypothetical protein
VDINGTGQRVCVVPAGRRTRTGTKMKRKNSKSADEKNSHSGRNDKPVAGGFGLVSGHSQMEILPLMRARRPERISTAQASSASSKT